MTSKPDWLRRNCTPLGEILSATRTFMGKAVTQKSPDHEGNTGDGPCPGMHLRVIRRPAHSDPNARKTKSPVPQLKACLRIPLLIAAIHRSIYSYRLAFCRVRCPLTQSPPSSDAPAGDLNVGSFP